MPAPGANRRELEQCPELDHNFLAPAIGVWPKVDQEGVAVIFIAGSDLAKTLLVHERADVIADVRRLRLGESQRFAICKIEPDRQSRTWQRRIAVPVPSVQGFRLGKHGRRQERAKAAQHEAAGDWAAHVGSHSACRKVFPRTICKGVAYCRTCIDATIGRNVEACRKFEALTAR